MSREIKFRAFERGNMEYFDFYIADCFAMSETVMQYTGLKDKNGKEIYEGDIVQHKNGWTGVITWNQDDCAFISESIKDRADTAWLAHDIQEVIGNIYENEDLVNDQ